MSTAALLPRSEKISMRRLLWAAPLAGLAAAAGNLAVFGVARAGLGLPLVMPALPGSAGGPLAVEQVLYASFVPALAGAALLALLARYIARPVRAFQLAAGAALILSFGAPLTLAADLATRLVLLTLHLAAGLIIASVLSTFATE
jgi:hypothetical protein